MQAVEVRQHGEITDLVTLLARQAARYGDKPVYSYLDRQLRVTTRITFAQLYAKACVLAGALRAQGLHGKPLLMLYLPGQDFPVAFWAAILAGACPVPLARPRGRDWSVIERIRKRSGAETILGSASLLRLLPASLLASLRILSHDDWLRFATAHPERLSGSTSQCAASRRLQAGAYDTALLQFTSGSTGRPKGVMLTHANVLANLRRISDHFACQDHDIGLCWLPLHHDMGLIGHVLQPVFAGIHNYFMAPVHFLGRPLRWLEAISEVGATISGAPCFAYALCADALAAEPAVELDLRRWRVAYCGAEKISATVLREFHQRCAPAGLKSSALYPCYGLAESTLFVTGRHSIKLALAPPVKRRRNIPEAPELVSVGAVDKSLRVVDPVSGRECDESEAGEIWLSSPSVAAGYYNDRHTSADCFEQHLPGVAGRFLRTGDIGMVVDGELYLIGR